ncbi:MAG: hypothetical protein JXX14_05110 [Deltaproteobacteria bacterium]|nr:hypothetical protein [Deltaproteobacteria bacterium]
MRKLHLIIIASTWLATPALANSTDARKVFMDGTALFEQNDYIKAAEKFRHAYELEPSWKIFYNIAQCEAAAKQYGRAMESFEKFLALGGDEITNERQEEVEAELDRLRRLVGFVEILAPKGSTVFIDNQARGTTPLPGKLMVAASVVHQLRIEQDGRELLSRKLEVSGTQAITVDVNNTQSVRSEPDHNTLETETQPKSASRHPLKTAGIITSGIGGALLVVSAITGGLAIRKSNDLAGSCPEKVNCEENDQRLKTSGETLQTVTNVLLITGAMLTTGGVTMAILGHKKSRRESNVAVAPILGRELAGISVQGKF